MVHNLLSNTLKNLHFVYTYWKCSRVEIHNYKLNLKLIVFITTLKQLMFVISWSFLFKKYPIIGGWSVNEMFIMFSIVSFGVATVEILFYGLRDIAYLVDSNQIDIFLIRPKNVLFMIGASKTNILAFGDLISSIILAIYSGYCSYKNVLWIIFFYLNSCIFIFSLYVFLGSLAFFIKNADTLIKELYRGILLLATQPNSIYRGLLKIITLTVIPVSYLSFYPTESILQGNLKFMTLSCLGTFVFFVTSISFFKIGLTKYISGV